MELWMLALILISAAAMLFLLARRKSGKQSARLFMALGVLALVVLAVFVVLTLLLVGGVD